MADITTSTRGDGMGSKKHFSGNRKQIPFTKKAQITIPEKRVVIAIPMYDEKIAGLGMSSVLGGMELLRKNGIQSTLLFRLGDPYIDLTRNKLVVEFLKSGYTDIIFVDNDLSFDSDAFLKLMSRDVQVIGGAYPYRFQGKQGYPLKPKADENNNAIINNELQLIECEHIPTGMMRIRRDVFDILKRKYPYKVDNEGELQFFGTGQLPMYEAAVERLVKEIKLLRGGGAGSMDIEKVYDSLDNQTYGEDVYFCKICNEAGIKVYCDPTINFLHIGTYKQPGNFLKYLNEQATSQESGVVV
ncbi:MAG: hypothetical protein M0R74_11355 [Dehalococcoidia bacterium]|nr:hypothetical protein [Dehalococcoidia bacterium]